MLFFFNFFLKYYFQIKDTNEDICVTINSIINLICSTMFVGKAVERGYEINLFTFLFFL